MTTYLEQSKSVQGSLLNESVAQQVANAADTYLTGSRITQSKFKVRSHLKIRLVATKTAAGVAAPIFKLRLGPIGDITDATRLTLASPTAQTAAIDTACIDIYCIIRTLGTDDAAAIISGHLRITHDLAATGFADRATPSVHGVSAAFDMSAITNPSLGLSVDPGAAGVWTFEQVVAELLLT